MPLWTGAQIPAWVSAPVVNHHVGKHFFNTQWKFPLLQLEFGVSCSFTVCDSLAWSFLQLILLQDEGL